MLLELYFGLPPILTQFLTKVKGKINKTFFLFIIYSYLPSIFSIFYLLHLFIYLFTKK